MVMNWGVQDHRALRSLLLDHLSELDTIPVKLAILLLIRHQSQHIKAPGHCQRDEQTGGEYPAPDISPPKPCHH